MSDVQNDRADEWGGQRMGYIKKVLSPCPACPTPGQCTNTDKCVEPKAGETWHILRAGATACATVTIAGITQSTVLFEPTMHGVDGERLPLRQGLQFLERVSGPNVEANLPTRARKDRE